MRSNQILEKNSEEFSYTFSDYLRDLDILSQNCIFCLHFHGNSLKLEYYLVFTDFYVLLLFFRSNYALQ